MFDDLVNLYDDFTKNGRTQALERFAFENGFEFTKRASFGTQSSILHNLTIFQKKGVKRLLGIMNIPTSEDVEGEFRFYDFLTTKDLETKTTSIIEYYNPSVDFGNFIIKPRKGISKVFTFKSNTSLQKQFEKNFRSIPSLDFSSETMSLLMQQLKLTIECERDICIFYLKNKEIQIYDILEKIDFAENFIRSLVSSPSDDFV